MINGWRRIGLRSRREEGWSRPRNGRLKELLPLRRALAITKSRSGIWRTTRSEERKVKNGFESFSLIFS